MASLTRRALIGRASGLTVVGLSLPLLAACGLAPRPSSGPTSAGGGASSSKVKIPPYLPVEDGPKADLPARADGVDAGYLTFPQTLFKSVNDARGKGEDVTLLTNILHGPVVGLDQNAASQ